MSADELIVLRAGMPPVRGRKIVFWRERAFARRVTPPPLVAPHSGVSLTCPPGSTQSLPPASSSPAQVPSPYRDDDDLTLNLVIPALDAAGLEPLPPQGASDAEVEAWVERFIDASVQPKVEVDHGR